MEYNINIEFTSNEKRAGKLTLTGGDGTVVLSKVPVAIPQGLGLVFDKRNLKTLNIEREGEYAQERLRLAIQGVESVILDNKSIPFFIAQRESSMLEADKKLFVLKKRDYETLFNIVKENEVHLKAQQVSFLWFPEKVVPAVNTVLESLNKLKITEVKASAVVSSAPLHSGKKIFKNTEIKSDIPVQKKVEQKTVAPVAHTTRAYPSRTQAREDNYMPGYDPMDVYFQYTFPELALMFRPTSLIALISLLNKDPQNFTPEYISNNINKVPGFESVGGVDIKYTEKGYSVELYDKENNSQGTLNVGEDNSYALQSPTGHSTYVQQDDSGIWNGATTSTEGQQMNYEFAPTAQGYIGNWSAEPENGPKIEAGVSMGYDFQPHSGDTYNLSDYQRYEPAPVSVDTYDNTNTYVPNSYTPEPTYNTSNTGYDNSYTPTYEPEPTIEYQPQWEPPPPPPPPPEDTTNWSSSYDSYSSSSFRM